MRLIARVRPARCFAILVIVRCVDCSASGVLNNAEFDLVAVHEWRCRGNLLTTPLLTSTEYTLFLCTVAFFGKQIQGCDAILARMQEMLLGFQADLGGISDEIKHLQVSYVYKNPADLLVNHLAVPPHQFSLAEVASEGSTETQLQHENRQMSCQRCVVFRRPW